MGELEAPRAPRLLRDARPLTHARCGLYYMLDGTVQEECERAGEPCAGAAP